MDCCWRLLFINMKLFLLFIVSYVFIIPMSFYTYLTLLLVFTNTNENLIRMLQSNAPIFCFTRIDENTFNFTLEMQNRTMTHDFKLGEEHEMERRDGSKVKITYTLEGENVLKQVIIPKDGRVAYFRREFGENEVKMIIKMEGTDVEAVVYYEEVK